MQQFRCGVKEYSLAIILVFIRGKEACINKILSSSYEDDHFVMVLLRSTHDISSFTTESMPGDGVATPSSTENGTLGDDSAIREWLRSSKTDDETDYFGSSEVTRTSDPRAGDTFVILDKSQNRVLACYGGQLHFEDANKLDSEEPIPRHWQWLCTEKNGFKGFQNNANRGFLGHDVWWDFYAKVPHHEGWESFTVSRREGGYYWIQALYWWRLYQVSARPDGRGLFSQRDGGTLWEFVKINEA